jgi:hypothetical protein
MAVSRVKPAKEVRNPPPEREVAASEYLALIESDFLQHITKAPVRKHSNMTGQSRNPRRLVFLIEGIIVFPR